MARSLPPRRPRMSGGARSELAGSAKMSAQSRASLERTSRLCTRRCVERLQRLHESRMGRVGQPVGPQWVRRGLQPACAGRAHSATTIILVDALLGETAVHEPATAVQIHRAQRARQRLRRSVWSVKSVVFLFSSFPPQSASSSTEKTGSQKGNLAQWIFTDFTDFTIRDGARRRSYRARISRFWRTPPGVSPRSSRGRRRQCRCGRAHSRRLPCGAG